MVMLLLMITPKHAHTTVNQHLLQHTYIVVDILCGTGNTVYSANRSSQWECVGNTWYITSAFKSFFQREFSSYCGVVFTVSKAVQAMALSATGRIFQLTILLAMYSSASSLASVNESNGMVESVYNFHSNMYNRSEHDVKSSSDVYDI